MATLPVKYSDEPIGQEREIGVHLQIFPAAYSSDDIEVQRAPDSAGSPVTGSAVTIDVLPPGTTLYKDVTRSFAPVHYRIRGIGPNKVASAWTCWFRAEPKDLNVIHDSTRHVLPVEPIVVEEADNTSTTATLTLTIQDPQCRVFYVEMAATNGRDAWTSWDVIADTGTSKEARLYARGITKVEVYAPSVAYRVWFYDSAGALRQKTGVVTFPALGTAQAPWGELRKVSDSTTQETIRLTGHLGTGGTTPLQYRYRVSTIGSVPAFSAWANIGTGADNQTVDLVVTRPPRFPAALDVEVRDGTLRVEAVATYIVLSTQDYLATDGRLDPDYKYSGMNIMTPRAASKLGHGLFLETFEEGAAGWTLISGSGTDSTVSTGRAGGNALRVAGGQNWREWSSNIPFDPSKLHRIRARVRMTVAPTDSAKDLVYFGVNGIAGDGTTRVNRTGANDASNQHYIAASAKDMGALTLNTWYEFTGYFKGWGASAAENPDNASDPTAPCKLHPNVRYIRPMFIVNYSAGNGTMEVDEIAIDVFDETAADFVYKTITDLDRLKATTKFKEATGFNLAMMRGVQVGYFKDGEAIDFTNEGGFDYPRPPRVFVLPYTCKTVHGAWVSAGFYDQYPIIEARDITATGFTGYAKLHAPQGATLTLRELGLGNADDLDVAGEAGTPQALTNGPAHDNAYTVRGLITLAADLDESKFPPGGSITVRVQVECDINGDGDFADAGDGLVGTPQDIVFGVDGDIAVTDQVFVFEIVKSGLTAASQFRLKLVSITNTSYAVITDLRVRGKAKTGGVDNGVSDDGINFYTSSGTPDLTTSATPLANQWAIYIACLDD